MAYSFLWVCTFGSKYLWETMQPVASRRRAVLLLCGLAIGAQSLVVLVAASAGTVFDQGVTAQAGVVALLLLAGLVAWFGNTEQTARLRFWSTYSAGLLLTLAFTWTLSILYSPLPFDLVTIAPASYLVVTAPFLLREKTMHEMQPSGYVLAATGALALLLPAFFMSFSDQGGDLLAVFLLLGETLALLLLGIGTRERFFVLGGCALVVVGALRVLFYAIGNASPLAILAVAIAGLAILGVAVFLVLHQRSSSGSVKHTP